MLFYYLLSVAAKTITLKAQSKDELTKIKEIHNVSSSMFNIVFDKALEADKYVIESNNIAIPANDLFELKELITISETLEDVPNQIGDVFETLKNVKNDPISDLKSGAFNFAVFFTNKPEDFKLLKGIEESSGFKYFISSDESLAKKLNSAFPGIVAYNALDKNVLNIPFYGTFVAISSAISVRAFSKISNDAFKRLQDLEQPIYYIIDKTENYEKIANDFGSLFKAQASLAKFIFFTPEEIPTLINLVKAQDSDYPMVINLSKNHKSVVRQLTLGNFATSMENLKNQKAESLRFASTIPEDNEKRPLKVLNSDTIHPLIENVSSDRIIAFTSPKCGHCLKLKPELIRFATMLSEKKRNITVGEYNIIENEDVGGLEITGIPVIYYIAKGTKELVLLDGAIRDVEKLLKYVAEKGVSAQIKLEDFKDVLSKPEEAEKYDVGAEKASYQVNKGMKDSTQTTEGAKEVL